MGVFTTVYATRRCVNCSTTFRTDVQFKTGQENGTLPQCCDGEQAPEIPTGAYEGIVDAYCDDCRDRWIAAEKRASFGALAEQVRRGVATVHEGAIIRRQDYVPVPDANDDFTIEYVHKSEITPEQLEEHGSSPDGYLGWPNFAARLGRLDYVVHVQEKRVYPSRVVGADWLGRIRRSVSQRLVAEGWPSGDGQWVDVLVEVDEHHVVRVIPDL